MRLVALNCNQCGAPLEVPSGVRLVACDYCSAQLEIHPSGNAVRREGLDQIDQRTAQIADDLESIRIQHELSELDHRWMSDRERYKVRGQDGQYSVPTVAGSVIGMIAVIVFGIFWIGMAMNMGAPPVFPLFGIGFIVFAFVAGFMGLTKAQDYRRHHSQYQSRRRELSRKLWRH